METPDQGLDREGLLPPPLPAPPYGEYPPNELSLLRDLPPATPEQTELFNRAEQFEPFSSGPLETQMQLAEELNQQAQATVLAAEEVQQLLENKRYIAIGASLQEDRVENTTSLVFILRNYDDHQTIEVWLDENGQQVTEVVEAPYQPAPHPEEINRAIQLAQEDSRLATHLSEHLEGTAIVLSPADPLNPKYNHRIFDVRFGRVDERLPQYYAQVDLDVGEVVSAGSVQNNDLPRERGE